MTDALAVFDLDGTLVETGPDLVDTTNVVLAENGHRTVAPETLHPFIGLGARAMIEGALTASGTTLASADVDRIFTDYIAHYSRRIAKLSRPFPEMLAALDALDAAGVAVAVCTNKREDLARTLLDALDLTPRFTVITGGDTYAVCKPDPAHLTNTIEAANASPRRTVFVGDSRVDRETAAAAGIPIVGVTYGYSDVPMKDLAPDRLLGPGEDVAASILELLAARPAVASALR